MKYKFSFIGCGNMGSALASAVAKRIQAEKIALCDALPEKAAALADRLACVNSTLAEVVSESEYLFIAVKPQTYAELFKEILPIIEKREKKPIFISMAAGTSIEKLTAILGAAYPIIRIMPNTPVAAGCGVILYSHNSEVSEDNIKEFLFAMTDTGLVLPIDEDKFDSESIVTGCGPAYVFTFIGALAKAAAALGVPEDVAELYAKQTVLGAATLAMQSEEGPEKLCQNVCSPGGSTIEGIKLMREREFEKTVVDAANASYQRTLEMKKL